MGRRPAAERICLRRSARCSCHSASVRKVRGVKWVSVWGMLVLRESVEGTWAGAGVIPPQRHRVAEMAPRFKRFLRAVFPPRLGVLAGGTDAEGAEAAMCCRSVVG